MEIEGPDEEEQRKSLVRHSIYGFERLRLRGEEAELEEAVENGPEALLRLFADRDALEAAHYREIVGSRLDVIKAFETMVDEDDKERVLQEWLFDHLWLLDPAWDRATEDVAMEERLRLKAPLTDTEATKEKFGRVDIRYRTVAGRHMLVELKRVSARPSPGQLLDQVTKYVEAFRELDPNDTIEPVIVVGKPIEGAEESLRGRFPGAKVCTYDDLIIRAKQSYGEYLERARSVNTLERILEPAEKDEDAERNHEISQTA